MPAFAGKIKIVAFGDSLTAGYGLRPSEAFPAVLAEELAKKGLDVEIINQGISGDTALGGARRIGQALELNPDGLILELGANDGLNEFAVFGVKANLERMIQACQAKGVAVLLTGMKALAEPGSEYDRLFTGMYPELAARYRLKLYPYFLEGVHGVPGLNLPDRLHPNAEGIKEIVRRMLPLVIEFVAGLEAEKAASHLQ